MVGPKKNHLLALLVHSLESSIELEFTTINHLFVVEPSTEVVVGACQRWWQRCLDLSSCDEKP